MNKEIKISIKGIGGVNVEKGTALKDISKKFFKDDYRKYLGAKINNEVFNLNTKVEESIDLNSVRISLESIFELLPVTYTSRLGRLLRSFNAS